MNSQGRMKTRKAGHPPFAQMAEIQESLDEAKVQYGNIERLELRAGAVAQASYPDRNEGERHNQLLPRRSAVAGERLAAPKIGTSRACLKLAGDSMAAT